MDYGAALEMRFGATRRGFESRPLRHTRAARLDADAGVVACGPRSRTCRVRSLRSSDAALASAALSRRGDQWPCPGHRIQRADVDGSAQSPRSPSRGAGTPRVAMGDPTMTEIEIVPLELAEFRFPEPELAGRRGVVMGYAVRHPDGILLFDTGFGFGNEELEETYHPVGRPIAKVLRDAGIDGVTSRRSRTATSTPTMPARTARSRGAHPRPSRRNGSLPTRPTTRSSSGSTRPVRTLTSWSMATTTSRPAIRLIATPGHTRGHQSLAVDDRGRRGGPCRPGLLHGGRVGGRSGRPRGPQQRPGPRLQYDASIERLRALEPSASTSPTTVQSGRLDPVPEPRLLSFRGRARRGTSGAL